jgi:glutathione S-transferase
MIELMDTRLSGNAWKVRLLLKALDLPFKRVSVDLLEEETRAKTIGGLNPFNRIPIVRFPDGTTVYESSVILMHLAKGTRYLPADDIGFNEVMTWLFFEQADLMHFVSCPRFFTITGQADQRADEINLYKSLAKSGLNTLNNALKARDWVASSGMSIADFAHFPYLRLAHQGGIDMSPYPAIQDWMQRFQSHDWFEELDAGGT